MTNNKNKEERDGKRSINEGYQPDRKGYKPNGDSIHRPGHVPERSETKPINPPKNR